ncbi:alpha/beta hydrolase fold domain-containing protein [Mycolicibacterium alvei]|uniref:alpha/beta hydrolase fold domain-containing protein n=1 Tax=Mycolicibacterium alvei TaxID=67081 RepID=UPI0013D6111A|nr:alpha/beta hydrolase [Mycolicibacterium alvei]MCV7003084.1 alpha/beta hydrolase [Mycolicibacterium alvei]
MSPRARFRHRFLAKALLLSRLRNWTLRPAMIDRLAAGPPRQPYAGLPPKRVFKSVAVTRSDIDGWPVYEISPKLSEPAVVDGHVLYLHGGCYVAEFAPALYWPFLAKMSVLVRRTITVPIFPLTPEYSYRDVYPLLLNVYRRILGSHDPKSIVFMGDSAGGGLTLGLCHAGRDAGLPQPSDAVLLSPWLHAGLPDPAVAAVAKLDPVLNLEFLHRAARHFAGGDSLDHPLLSPAVGSLTGLPKITVLTGTHDMLNPDARAFRRRAQADGIEIGWYELDEGIHGWMGFSVLGRDADDACYYIRDVLRRRC